MIILYFFTTVVKINPGHFMALIAIIGLYSYNTVTSISDTNDFNKTTEYRMKSLYDEPGETPVFLYADADIINLFYDMKQDLAVYNYKSYKSAVKCADNVLRIRIDIEKKICMSPKVPDIHKNFTPGDLDKDEFLNPNDYSFTDDKICDSILTNAYENYQVAEEYVKKCMNYLHSMIISIPSNPVLHRKHEQVSDRLHILLKRNLDVIKKIYNKSLEKGISHATKFISDYDLPKAYNKHREEVNTEFNFY